MLAALLLLVTSARVATPQAAAPPAVRFGSVDVFIDAGDTPLAAYQFEVKAKTGHVLLVGLEGGEHPAFKSPPYYDPQALLGGNAGGDRIIVAAFNAGADLPRGKTRVARLHVQIAGDAEPAFDSTLQVAAGSDGAPIPATLSISTPAAAGTSGTSPATQGVTP